MKKAHLSAFMVLGLSACATLGCGCNQHVSVDAFYQGQQIDDAECTLVNSAGTWIIPSQGSVDVRRSYSTMTVTCTKKGLPAGVVHAESSTGEGTFVDRIADGIWGNVVDTASAAIMNYPSVITVEMGQTLPMQDKEESQKK